MLFPVNDLDKREYIEEKDDVKLENVEGVKKVAPAYISLDGHSFPGYYSDQFKSKLQKKMNATDKAFYSLGEQNIDLCKVPLRCLDIEKDILDDFTVVIVGRRRSGKSFLARYLMYHKRHSFPCGAVITGTKLNNYWAKYVPREFIHDVEDMNSVIEQVFKRQDFILKYPELEIDPRMFLILDDVMSDKYRLRFSKALSKIFTDGRHHKIFILVTVQDPRGLPPDLRENADLAIIFRQLQETRKEAVSKDFLSYIDCKNDRLRFLWEKTKRVTEDGDPFLEEGDDEIENTGIPQALCVLQADITEDFRKIFKVLVAEDPGEFELGNERFWKVTKTGNYRALQHTFKNFISK